MHAVPRPVPRVAPATSATFPLSCCIATRLGHPSAAPPGKPSTVHHLSFSPDTSRHRLLLFICRCGLLGTAFLEKRPRIPPRRTMMKRFLFLTLAAGLLTATPACAADKNPVVVMETSKGTIKIELFNDKAP